MNFIQKDFIDLSDFSKDEILFLLKKAEGLKKDFKKNKLKPLLKNKVLAMIFSKSSTRTRVSFESGMTYLGGKSIFLNQTDIQLGRGETIEDTGKVLSRYVDAIMIRTYSHEDVFKLAASATVPVINGLTDYNHPCQALADFLTIKEKFGSFKDIRIAFIGDGNNVVTSLITGCIKLGVPFSIASPKGYECKQNIQELAKGYPIHFTNDPIEAVKGANVIYSDVWVSMGQESEREKRLKDFQNYQVNEELVKHADPNYIFLHCLPAHRDEEVVSSVIDGKHSYVFDQAENRMHAQNAVLTMLIK